MIPPTCVQSRGDLLVGFETTSGACVLLTRTELILLMTVKNRLCRQCLVADRVTPLCRQLKLHLPPALQATLVVQVVCPLLGCTFGMMILIATLSVLQIGFT